MRSDKIILIDQDAVIANIIDYWLERLNIKFHKRYTEEDVTDFQLHKVLQLPERAIYDVIDEPGFFWKAKVVKDSQYVLEDLWERFDCRIVTAASYSNNAVREKWMWLQEHFPFIEKEKIVFTKDKSIVRGDFLIDDAPHNLEVFHSIPIIFDRPWNRQLKLDHGIRLKNWLEIRDFFIKE